MSSVNNGLKTALHTDITGSSKCCICVDEHLADGTRIIADAITMAPTTQIVSVSGQMVAAIVALPVCLEHRKQQLAPVSRSGLVTM